MQTKDKVKFIEDALRQADVYISYDNRESAMYQGGYVRGLVAAWNADSTISFEAYKHFMDELSARSI